MSLCFSPSLCLFIFISFYYISLIVHQLCSERLDRLTPGRRRKWCRRRWGCWRRDRGSSGQSGGNVIKLFFSLLMTRPNKLECLYLAIPFQSSLTFAADTRSLPKRKYLKGAPLGLPLALPKISKTWLERVSKDKPSILLGLVVSNEGKKFYNIDTCCQFDETFFFVSDDKAIIVLWQAFPALSYICDYPWGELCSGAQRVGSDHIYKWF